MKEVYDRRRKEMDELYQLRNEIKLARKLMEKLTEIKWSIEKQAYSAFKEYENYLEKNNGNEVR